MSPLPLDSLGLLHRLTVPSGLGTVKFSVLNKFLVFILFFQIFFYLRLCICYLNFFFYFIQFFLFSFFYLIFFFCYIFFFFFFFLSRNHLNK